MDADKVRAAEHRLWASLGTIPKADYRIHLKRNDVSVRLQEVGEGPPVLFIHGALVNGGSYSSLVSRLTHFRCLVLDRPGAGLSDPLAKPPTIETLPSFGDDLVADVLDALEIDSAHVVSSSFGGYFALRGAAAHPDRVRRIVHFSFPVGAPVDRFPLSQRMMGWPFVWRILQVPPTRPAVRMMFRMTGQGQSLTNGGITQHDIDGWIAVLRHTDTRRNEMAMGRSFFTPRGIAELSLTDDELARIGCPVLLYWGENEPVGGADVARRLADRIPNAELELIPGSGHAPWLDDLDRAAKTVTAFFNRS